MSHAKDIIRATHSQGYREGYDAGYALGMKEGRRSTKRPGQIAEDFLLAELAEGPRLTVEVNVRAVQQDISLRTLREARARLGIKVSRRGAAYVWSLDGGLAA